MRFFAALATMLLICGQPALAAPALPSYKIDASKSSLKFGVYAGGELVSGYFDDYSAVIHYDPKKLDDSSIKVTVKTGSVKLADAAMAKVLKDVDWLGVQEFPEAVFEAKGVNNIPGTRDFYTQGELKLKGVTRQVNLNFRVDQQQGDVMVANGFVTLQRGEFGVGAKAEKKTENTKAIKHADSVKEAVRVEFRIYARKE